MKNLGEGVRLLGQSARSVPKGNKREAFEQRLSIYPVYHLLWKVGLSTGLRVSDILPLTVGELLHGHTAIVAKKTGKPLRVSFPADVIAEVARYADRRGLRPADFAFSATSHGRPLHRGSVWRVFALCGASAGLVGVGSHSMRKTYAKDFIERTGDLRALQEALQEALQHKFISTTIGYLLDMPRPGVKGRVEIFSGPVLAGENTTRPCAG